jgi:hypothetical protein
MRGVHCPQVKRGSVHCPQVRRGSLRATCTPPHQHTAGWRPRRQCSHPAAAVAASAWCRPEQPAAGWGPVSRCRPTLFPGQGQGPPWAGTHTTTQCRAAHLRRLELLKHLLILVEELQARTQRVRKLHQLRLLRHQRLARGGQLSAAAGDVVVQRQQRIEQRQRLADLQAARWGAAACRDVCRVGAGGARAGWGGGQSRCWRQAAACIACAASPAPVADECGRGAHIAADMCNTCCRPRPGGGGGGGMQSVGGLPVPALRRTPPGARSAGRHTADTSAPSPRRARLPARRAIYGTDWRSAAPPLPACLHTRDSAGAWRGGRECQRRSHRCQQRQRLPPRLGCMAGGGGPPAYVLSAPAAALVEAAAAACGAAPPSSDTCTQQQRAAAAGISGAGMGHACASQARSATSSTCCCPAGQGPNPAGPRSPLTQRGGPVCDAARALHCRAGGRRLTWPG